MTQQISEDELKKIRQNSYPMDEGLEGFEHEAWFDFLNIVEQTIVGIESRERSRTKDAQKTFRAALSVLMANALSAWKQGGRGFHLSLSVESYGKHGINPDLTFHNIQKILKVIAEGDYKLLKKYKGEFHGGIYQGYRTRLKATPTLHSLFKQFGLLGAVSPIWSNSLNPIVLKDKDKKPIGYEDTPEVLSWKRSLTSINEYLRLMPVNLLISDAELEEINADITGEGEESEEEEIELYRSAVNFDRRFLRRVFNNNSFRNGGRFYGGWWQGLPEKWRQRITINGNPTVEIDYKGMQVAQLYARKKLVFEGDDPYQLEGVDNSYRKILKRLFTRMLNTKSDTPPRKKDLHKYPLPNGLTIKDIEVAFTKLHRPIADYFHKKVAVELQFEDSQVAEVVMLSLIVDGITVLPIHDSFIVERRFADRLIAAMRDNYKQLVNFHYAPEKDISGMHEDEFNELKQKANNDKVSYRQYHMRDIS